MAALAAVGYLYDVSTLYMLGPFTAVAPHAAVALVLLSLGIVLARPERGLIAILLSDSPGSMVARSLLARLLIAPPLLGAAVLLGERRGFYEPAAEVWILVLSTVLLCTAFAWAAANSLHAADSARREAEIELRRAKEWYRRMVEHVPLVVYVDALDDTSSAIYMSPQIEPLLGYPVEQWLSDPVMFPKILYPEDRRRVMAEIRRCRRRGEQFSCEYRLFARDGRIVWVHDEAAYVPPEPGRRGYAQGLPARHH